MTSGAGHDAQRQVCPGWAMVFVPSSKGLSHNPDYTSQEEIERGANVLLHMLLNVAEVHDG